jgi:hypothetical protein
MRKIWASSRSTLLPAATAVMVLAGASLALASAPAVRDVVRAARGVVAGEDDGSDDGLQLVDVRAGGGTGHRGRGGAEDLESVLGVTPGCVTAAGGGQLALDSATGLAHAMAVVEANCGENPQAVGLANALARQQQNLAHQGAHVSHAGGNGQGNGAGGSDGQGQAGEHGVGDPNGGQGAGGDPKGQSTDPHGTSTDPGNGNGGGGAGGTDLG